MSSFGQQIISFYCVVGRPQSFPGGVVVKNPLANARDATDGSLTLGSGIPPGEGNDNLLAYSCLKNPMDRADWWSN